MVDVGQRRTGRRVGETNFENPTVRRICFLNNAGLINRNARLWEIGAGEFSQVVDVNLKGVANVIRHFVPAMVKNKSGVIVNFSSGWGRSTDAEVAPYLRHQVGD